MFGAMFPENFNALLVISALIMFPFIFFCGFIVRSAVMPDIFKPLAHFSFVKYAFESELVTIYGFGRCDAPIATGTAQDTAINAGKVKEFVAFLQDWDIWDNFTDITAQAIPTEGLDSDSFFKFKPGESLAVTTFSLKDSMLWYNTWILIGFLIFLRMMAFWILRWKANSANETNDRINLLVKLFEKTAS